MKAGNSKEYKLTKAVLDLLPIAAWISLLNYLVSQKHDERQPAIMVLPIDEYSNPIHHFRTRLRQCLFQIVPGKIHPPRKIFYAHPGLGNICLKTNI